MKDLIAVHGIDGVEACAIEVESRDPDRGPPGRVWWGMGKVLLRPTNRFRVTIGGEVAEIWVPDVNAELRA